MKSITGLLHHLFIPKEENNYRAKSLQTDFLTFYLVIALTLAFLFKNLSYATGNVLGIATNITVEKLYSLTNQERTKYNLPPLIYNEKLAQAAEKKAQDMFKNDYWAHYSPDGETPWNFMLGSGYKYEYAGENLAKNFLFSENVVDAWMKSESHRENVLRREYEEIGFAIVNGNLNGEETTLVVQMFGKPQTNISSPVKTANAFGKPQGSILAKEANKPYLNLLDFSFNFNFIFVTLMILLLILDFYFVAKSHVFRLSGKNIAHIIFLGFILSGIFYIAKGAII